MIYTANPSRNYSCPHRPAALPADLFRDLFRGSCIIVARIIRCELLHQTVTESDLLTLGRRYAPQIEEFVRLGCQPEIEPLHLDDSDTRGYTLRTLAAGLWAYNFGTDFRSAIQTLIAAGGDTDTNCAVAGALLGSRLGYATLPEDWVYGLLRRDELTGKARQLTEILPQSASGTMFAIRKKTASE